MPALGMGGEIWVAEQTWSKRWMEDVDGLIVMSSLVSFFLLAFSFVVGLLRHEAAARDYFSDRILYLVVLRNCNMVMKVE